MKHLLYITLLIIFHPFVMADSHPLNKRDKDGRTKLHYAVIPEDLEPNKLGSIPLRKGDAKGDLVQVRSYLERGANPDIPDKWGHTPFFYVASTGNLPMFHLLLKKSANLDIQNRKGDTLLHIASYYKHLEIARILIDKKSVNRYTSDSTQSQVFVDQGQDDVEMLQKLFSSINPTVRKEKKEASLYIKNNLGEIPIHKAAEGGHTQIVRLFIEKGVNPDILSGTGFAPIHIAILHGHLGLVRYLIDDGKANPNIQDISGRTPLDLAKLESNIEIIEFLLAHQCRTSF